MTPDPIAQRADPSGPGAARRARATGPGYHSPEEQQARGRAARRAVPRSAHAGWRPAPDRPDPIALLEEQAAVRVPELVPIRHGRMLVSPFTFYRGAALIMASDLAATPRTGFSVQCCGDAHLLNFGAFASPERQMLFDINDFDETLPGPWEWDVKRLAASFEVAGRDLGFAPADRRAVVLAAVAEYRRTILDAATRPTLEAWYAHLEINRLMEWIADEVRQKRLGKKEAAEAGQDVAKARTKDSMRAFTKFTRQVDGDLRIKADPPLIVPIEDLLPPDAAAATERRMGELIADYRKSLPPEHHPVDEFRYVHMARKVVGVGSVGTNCWIVLLLGRGTDDPLFLQVKEAPPSVLERFVGGRRPAHNGRRVVSGQRLMQAASDIFLGWLRVTHHDGQTFDYYVRQLHDWKGSADVGTMRVPGATLYARMCGGTLARAHARSGDRIAIGSYLGKSDTFDAAVTRFAARYADQNALDHAALEQAVASGRLTAVQGI